MSKPSQRWITYVLILVSSLIIDYLRISEACFKSSDPGKENREPKPEPKVKCSDDEISPNFKKLEAHFKKNVYGQHLATDIVLSQLQARRNNQPKKALVMSFHGSTGCGKNYVSKILAENIYKKGMKSPYVHLFQATSHFQHRARLSEYQDMLKHEIKTAVESCPQQLFIFDEMDKMDSELVNTLKPFVDYIEELDGIDYRKSTFIFLSNAGSEAIDNRTLELWYKKEREAIQLNEIEHLIKDSVSKEKGTGLWNSYLIKRSLIDAYVPFLPLERRHIKECIEDDIREKNYTLSDGLVSRVVQELRFFPDPIEVFSETGCKRVTTKVDYIYVRNTIL